MKICAFEYITGGGLRQAAIPEALAVEGRLMIDALASDLIELPDIELSLMQDDRISLPHTNARLFKVGLDADFKSVWQKMLDENDAIWPIAPETDGVLFDLCCEIEASGKILLNCPAQAVELATSKIKLIQRLQQKGLPTVPSVYLNEWTLNPNSLPHADLFVVKPDDGAGCEGSLIFSKPHEIKNESTQSIVQPLIKGDSLSLSAVFNHGEALLLSINRQLIVQSEQGFKLQGLRVNTGSQAPGSQAPAWEPGAWEPEALCNEIARALPELWGYAGIDFILTDKGPMILEVNPRLTTSYAGLKKATGINLAQLILDLNRTGSLPAGLIFSNNTIDIAHAH